LKVVEKAISAGGGDRSCGCGGVVDGNDAHNVDNAMGMGIGANRGGEGVSVDDDFTIGAVVELGRRRWG
jgi:hypothetical protein